MEQLTWTGALGFLNPILLTAVAIMLGAIVLQIVMSFFVAAGNVRTNPDGTLSVERGPLELVGMVGRYAFLAIVLIALVFLVGGVLMDTAAGKIGGISRRFLPVWVALVVLFTASIMWKRRLGLYGKLFDSMIGMIGFGLVMFWGLHRDIRGNGPDRHPSAAGTDLGAEEQSPRHPGPQCRRGRALPLLSAWRR